MPFARLTPHPGSSPAAVSTNVSESTRNDSRPPQAKDQHPLIEEFGLLESQIKEIDNQIAQLGPGRLQKEKVEWRRGGCDKSWKQIEGKLHEERRELRDKRARYATRRNAIADKVAILKKEVDGGKGDSTNRLLIQNFNMLVTINRRVKELTERIEGLESAIRGD